MRKAILMLLSVVAVLTLPTVAFGQTVVPTEGRCNPDKPETTPVSRFNIDEQAGTVFDTQTGLAWKRCAEGQTYFAGRCEGAAVDWNWNDAVTRFGVEGDGWRLPNVDELSSIGENRCHSPSVNLALFPDTPSSAFWSASPSTSKAESAWWVTFVYHGSDLGKKVDTFPVRLTRGKEWMDSSGVFVLGKEQKAKQVALSAEQERTETAKKKTEDRMSRIAALIDAERKAVISCRDKTSCDKAFSLTQVYIKESSDQKIQIATDTIIETYNPTEEGKIGLAATRTPGKGTSASIRLTATCNDGRYAIDLCLGKKKGVLALFPLFIQEKLK